MKEGSAMAKEKITRVYIKPGQKPTQEQIERIKEAAKRPITFDEDCPELTLEQYAEMAQIAREQRKKQAKQLVALRISADTLLKARATGKGYTGFLSRLLDNAINDPELVKKSL